MNKKSLCLAFGIFLVTAINLVLVISGEALARGRIIYIYGDFQGAEPAANVEPKITRENRQTTLIFLNESEVEVKIVFLDGKTCGQVARVAPGWNMKGTCYMTKDTIPPGGTSSIIFNSNGNFDYEVEYVGKNHKEKASIRISGPRGGSYRPY
jgi:hypothetical protein